MPSKRVKEKDVVVSAAVPARHKPATTKRDKRTAPVAAAATEAPATKAPAIQPVPVAAATRSVPVAAVTRSVPVAAVTRPVPVAPSQEEIASLAYSYWVARGYQVCSPEADCLRAEEELLAAAIA